MFKQV